jgi:hypothetical protein
MEKGGGFKQKKFLIHAISRLANKRHSAVCDPMKAIAGETKMADPIPSDVDALLTREQTAAALTSAGFPTKAKTLATKATRGGGPAYRHWGARPLYRWGDVLSWAQARLTEPVCSSSEADAARAVQPGLPTSSDCGSRLKEPARGPAEADAA